MAVAAALVEDEGAAAGEGRAAVEGRAAAAAAAAGVACSLLWAALAPGGERPAAPADVGA